MSEVFLAMFGVFLAMFGVILAKVAPLAAITYSMKGSKLKDVQQIHAQMQTEMSRGPLAEDEHSRKGMVGAALGRPPPFLFCRGHPLPFPLHFCLHLCIDLWGIL